MVEIIKNRIHLGSKEDYFKIAKIHNDWVYVHIGTELFNTNNSSKTKNDYIIDGNHFYLKWQDLPNLDEFNVETLQILFNFLDSYKDKNTFIHCDYGQSRSPAITMAYLSKRTEELPTTHYKAIESFKLIYPNYYVLGGITTFIREEWKIIK